MTFTLRSYVEEMVDAWEECEQCKDCKWWFGYAAKFADCRRNPPQLIGGIMGDQTAWPRTKDLEFCGEFTEKDKP